MAKVAVAPGNPWILSGAIDLPLIIGAPLLTVALLLPLAQVVSSHAIWVAVMAFGAVGHHLPGFLRTYGDRELFRRYRFRFLIAPPLVFAVTLWFSMRDLHGVALISLVWSAWHGMMQHYGFLRIYDVKVRATSPRAAHLDFALTLCWFTTCVLFSPNMGGSIIDAFQSTRLALPSPQSWSILRGIAFTATAVTTALYVAVTVRAIRRGEPVSWHKLALLITTTALVWFARVVTSDPYLSVALFEVLHDVQYLAIVWAFNRRLVTIGHDDSALSRALFSPHPSSIGAYVFMCMAYGAVAFATYTVLPEGTGKTVLVALLVTSGILHYYYDGFIWKLRRKETREGLALDDGPASGAPVMNEVADRRAFAHLAVFVAGVGALAAVEFNTPAVDPVAAAKEVAALVPGSPTARANAGNALMERGGVQEALPHLRESARLMPTAEAHTRLGQALLASGSTDEAVGELEEAARLDPKSAEARRVLGDAHLQHNDFGAAVRGYREAIRLGAGHPLMHSNLGYALIQTNDLEGAEQELQTALSLDPGLVGARLNIGLVFYRSGRVAAAIEQLVTAVGLRPDLVVTHASLGQVLQGAGRHAEAVDQFRAALRIDPGFEPAKKALAELSGR